MAAYDNKLLDGAGVAKLSQLIKEEIAQGGGSSYTAGAGIDIDSNNVISHTTPFPPFLSVFLGLVSGTTYNAGNNRSMIVPHESDYTKEQWKDVFLNTGEAFVYIDSAYAGPLAQAIAEIENITTTSQTINIINSSTSLMASQYTYTFSSTTAKPLNYWLTTNYVYYIAYNPSGFGLSSTKHHWVVIRDPFKQMASGYFQSTQGITATSIGGALDELATNIPSIATVATAGIVKPDGTTITVDANGVISSQGGGSSLPTDPSTDGVYKLVNTVETEGGVQTATQSWEEDAQYSFEEILQEFLNYTTIDDKTYQSIPNGEAVLGIYRSDNDTQAWTGVQSGKWFLWGWGSLTKTTITQLSNDYGITQWRLIGLSGGSSSSGPISGPYWKPQDVSGATCLCKRNDTAQKLDCVPVTNLNASLASLIITYMDVYDGNNNHARIRDWLSKIPSIATTQAAGIVKPDGTTITVDANGVISSQGGGGGASYTFTNGLSEDNGTVSLQLYDKFLRPYNNSVAIGSFITPNAQTNNSGWYNLVVGKGEGNYKTAPLFQCNSSQGSILFGKILAYNANKAGTINTTGSNGGNIIGGYVNSYDGNSTITAEGDGNIIIGQAVTGNMKCNGTGNIVIGQNTPSSGYTTGDILAGDSTTSATACQAFGTSIQVYGSNQMGHGKHNVIDRNNKFAEIVGNGTSQNNKSNASALDWNGNQYLAGNLYIGCTDYTTTSSGPTTAYCGGQKVATESYVDSRIPPCPTTTDGSYVLKCTVSNGTPTYSWVAEA